MEPGAARIELVNHLPLRITAGVTGSGARAVLGHRHHLHRARRQRPRPSESPAFDRLQIDVINPFPTRQRYVELHPFIGLEPWLGRRRSSRPANLGEECRLHCQRLRVGRGFESQPQLDSP